MVEADAAEEVIVESAAEGEGKVENAIAEMDTADVATEEAVTVEEGTAEELGSADCVVDGRPFAIPLSEGDRRRQQRYLVRISCIRPRMGQACLAAR